MVQEFKVLQSNFNAEHAKGPVTMSVLSKSGGRDFHGTLYGYWRDYHLNSNEWFANKVGSDRVKNQFFYPGFNVGGPLIIPGTGFNKNRDKVFFFLGYEYFKQRLDTGFVQVVGADPARCAMATSATRGDLGLSGGFVNRPPDGFANGVIPAGQIDPGGQALLNLYPMPNADPATTGGFNYVDNLLVDQNGTQLARARRPQRQRQHQDVRALQPATGGTAVRDRPVVAQRREPGALSVVDQRQEPLRLGDDQASPTSSTRR